MIDVESYVLEGKKVLDMEAQALLGVAGSLGESFSRAVEIILNHKGKIVVSGMGKSGYVAQKMAATFSSTGTPAVYLHPGEALHGDLGIYSSGDPTILLSKSGTTTELVRLIPTLRQFSSPIIAIVSNEASPIAVHADVVISAHVAVEADPLGVVPTSSTLVSMAIGDALASVLMKARGFEQADFAKLHPAGQLGRNLLFTVGDVMHRPDAVAVVSQNDQVIEAIVKMTDKSLGAACVVDEKGLLLGILTDGDVRRLLTKRENITEKYVRDVMTENPIFAEESMLLADALKLMEERKSQISVLPVKDPQAGRFKGLIRIHDIYRA